jgi:ribosomal protein S18 acetylase RimI-like enzyme
MGDFDPRNISVRRLEMTDLDAIVEIDLKIGKAGTRRYPYWRSKIEEMSHSSPSCSLVAEYDGKIIAFILGTVSGWEFGVPNTVGWIDIIGVDPAYQHCRVATMLFESILEDFQREGASHVYTLVRWEDWDLMEFFRAVGFTRGDMINLEYAIR